MQGWVVEQLEQGIDDFAAFVLNEGLDARLVCQTRTPATKAARTLMEAVYTPERVADPDVTLGALAQALLEHLLENK